LGLDFLNKIGVVVDVENGLIYNLFKKGLNYSVWILPLNMVNMFQLVTDKSCISDYEEQGKTL
jgi:hypothetical protein